MGRRGTMLNKSCVLNDLSRRWRRRWWEKAWWRRWRRDGEDFVAFFNDSSSTRSTTVMGLDFSFWTNEVGC